MFLSDLVDRAPLTMARVVIEQAADLQNPPASPNDVLTWLGRHAPRFAASVRAVLDQSLP